MFTGVRRHLMVFRMIVSHDRGFVRIMPVVLVRSFCLLSLSLRSRAAVQHGRGSQPLQRNRQE
jgi:hypothetical protein